MSERQRGRTSEWVVSLGAGLATGVVGLGISADARGAAVFGVIVFLAMVGLARLRASRRGTAFWTIALISWLAYLTVELTRLGGLGIRAGQHVPLAFVDWSWFALPVLLGLEWLASTDANTTRSGSGELGAVLTLWVLLLAPMVWLSRFAIDVGGGPLHTPLAMWSGDLLVLPAPIVLSAWGIRRGMRAPPNAARTEPQAAKGSS